MMSLTLTQRNMVNVYFPSHTSTVSLSALECTVFSNCQEVKTVALATVSATGFIGDQERRAWECLKGGCM